MDEGSACKKRNGDRYPLPKNIHLSDLMEVDVVHFVELFFAEFCYYFLCSAVDTSVVILIVVSTRYSLDSFRQQKKSMNQVVVTNPESRYQNPLPPLFFKRETGQAKSPSLSVFLCFLLIFLADSTMNYMTVFFLACGWVLCDSLVASNLVVEIF
jgi:hypothetical protein